jgi:hypothetical protein
MPLSILRILYLRAKQTLSMRKTFVFVIILLLHHGVHSQVEIKALHQHSDGRRTHSFPLIQSTDRSLADKINATLQSEILNNDVVFTDTTKLFAKSKFIQAGPNAQPGLSAIDFEVKLNTPFVLTLEFTLESTGAYSYYSTKYFTFDTKTGELLTIKNFMNATGVEIVGRRLIIERDKRISDWKAQMKKEYNIKPEDAKMINETFEKCNSKPDVNNFFIEKDSILFYKEPCFPHAARPYDTDLDIRISFKELAKYFTEAGQTRLLPPRKKRQKIFDDYRDEMVD